MSESGKPDMKVCKWVWPEAEGQGVFAQT